MGVFGIRQKEDLEAKRMEQAYIEKYAKKLDQYAKALDLYQKEIRKYDSKFEEEMEKAHDDQMYNVGVALDLKYLKEQGDQVAKNVVDLSEIHLLEIKNQMKESQTVITEINQNLKDQEERQNKIEKKIGSTNRLVKFFFVEQLFLIAGLIVLILYNMGLLGW